MGHLARAQELLAHAAPPGGGAHDILKRGQGLGQVAIDRHLRQQRGRGRSGHFRQALWIKILGLHHDKSAQAHVTGGPGRRADVFRQPRPVQDYGHPRKTHPAFRN